jgi:hypothetical protein
VFSNGLNTDWRMWSIVIPRLLDQHGAAFSEGAWAVDATAGDGGAGEVDDNTAAGGGYCACVGGAGDRDACVLCDWGVAGRGDDACVCGEVGRGRGVWLCVPPFVRLAS